jgi:outer membrane protein TolC
MVTLASSYPNMQLQQEAANYSDQNLSVIKDKYARGVVSILDLLDAQNQAFVARQQAAIAVYSYLEDIIDMQRIVSWFEVHKDDTERDALVDAMRAYLKTHRKSTGGAQP